MTTPEEIQKILPIVDAAVGLGALGDVLDMLQRATPFAPAGGRRASRPTPPTTPPLPPKIQVQTEGEAISAPTPHGYCPPGYALYYRIGQHTLLGPLQTGKEIVPSGGRYVCLKIEETSLTSAPYSLRDDPDSYAFEERYKQARQEDGFGDGDERSLYRPGIGAAGASEFTMTAARALDAQLAMNGYAGCGDMKSTLRQLTFAFKAACLTDTAVMNSVSLNVSTPLAMTGFGPGSTAALSLVLGGARISPNRNCTDDNGNCLPATQLPTPAIPPGVESWFNELRQKLSDAISQQRTAPLPQAELAPKIIEAFAALINQIGFELQKAKQEPPEHILKLKTPEELAVTPPAAPPTAWMPTKKILVGGLVGVTVIGVSLAVYFASKRKRAA